jgi:hypothetical protein
VDKSFTGQILLIAMVAINGWKGSTGIHHLPAHIYTPRTDCGTGPAKQALGKNILKHSTLTMQFGDLGQMDFAPGGMGFLTGNPIDRADNGTGPAFSAGIHNLKSNDLATRPARLQKVIKEMDEIVKRKDPKTRRTNPEECGVQ